MAAIRNGMHPLVHIIVLTIAEDKFSQYHIAAIPVLSKLFVVLSEWGSVHCFECLMCT